MFILVGATPGAVRGFAANRRRGGRCEPGDPCGGYKCTPLRSRMQSPMPKVRKVPTQLIHGVIPPTELTIHEPRPALVLQRDGDAHGDPQGSDTESDEETPSSTSSRRRWVYTLNNYTQEECDALVSVECVRHVCGREVAPSTGTPHLQGYIRFKNPVRFSWWKKNFRRARVKAARKGDVENEVYCTKEGNVLINKGVNYDDSQPKLSRDEETDQVIEEIEKGALYGQIRQRHKRFCFWHRRNVLDYMRDHLFLKDYPDANPTV